MSDVAALIRSRRWIVLLGLCLIAINRVTGLALPVAVKYLVDDVIGRKRLELLGPLLFLVVAAAALDALTAFLATQLMGRSGQRLVGELRRRVHEHILHLPLTYHDTNKTGVLVARVMNDVESVQAVVGRGVVDIIGSLATAAVAIVIMLHISPLLTILLVTTSAVSLVFVKRLTVILRPILRETRATHAEVTGRLAESLGGIRVIKGYHAESREATVFASGVGRLLTATLSSLRASAATNSVTTLLVGGMSASLIYVGSRQILAGSLTLGGLIAFTALLPFLVAPIAQIVQMSSQLTEAAVGLERTREVLREPLESESPLRTVALGKISGSIVFDNVSFGYKANCPVLREMNFEASPGSITALVGPSGAGKSTITGLIAAFYTPTSGAVRVDGVDLTSVRPSSYRTQLGLVLQETFLFEGTIRDNVLFARPDASESDVLEACRIAQVDEFARRFDNQYDTWVGERGVLLSGGQRQRISIARAILANPRILILDEATSSLDSESEELVQRSLSFLMRGRTTFVIAHRLSTIRGADQILLIEHGRVIGRGTHHELYVSCARYQELYARQASVDTNLVFPSGNPESTEAVAAKAG